MINQDVGNARNLMNSRESRTDYISVYSTAFLVIIRRYPMLSEYIELALGECIWWVITLQTAAYNITQRHLCFRRSTCVQYLTFSH